MTTLYCCVYRMGGKLRPIWQRTLPFGKEKCETMAEEIRQMGYKCMVEDYDLSMKIGLPEGWEYGDSKNVKLIPSHDSYVNGVTQAVPECYIDEENNVFNP